MATQLCTVCRGRQKVYQLRTGAYSLENMGGKRIDCLKCGGLGYTLVEVTVKKSNKRKRRKEEFLNNEVESSLENAAEVLS